MHTYTPKKEKKVHTVKPDSPLGDIFVFKSRQSTRLCALKMAA